MKSSKRVFTYLSLMTLIIIMSYSCSSSSGGSGGGSSSSNEVSLTFNLKNKKATALESRTAVESVDSEAVVNEEDKYINLLTMNEDGTIDQASFANYDLNFKISFFNYSKTKQYFLIDYDEEINKEINKALLGCSILEVTLSSDSWRCFDNNNRITDTYEIKFDKNDVAYYLGYQLDAECTEWWCGYSGNRRLIKNNNGTFEYLSSSNGVVREFHVTSEGDTFMSYCEDEDCDDALWSGYFLKDNTKFSTNFGGVLGDDYKSLLFHDDSMDYDYTSTIGVVSVDGNSITNRTVLPIVAGNKFISDNGSLFGVSGSYPLWGHGYVKIYSLLPFSNEPIFEIQKDELKTSNCNRQYTDSCWSEWVGKASFQIYDNKLYYVDNETTQYDKIIEHDLNDNSSRNIISDYSVVLPDYNAIKIQDNTLYFAGVDSSKSFIGMIDLIKLKNNESDYIDINYSSSGNSIIELNLMGGTSCPSTSNPTFTLNTNNYGFSLFFDQCMNKESVESNMSVTENGGSVNGVKLWFGNTLHYYFNQNLGTDNYTTAHLDNNTTYTLSLSNDITDTSGNNLTAYSNNITVQY